MGQFAGNIELAFAANGHGTQMQAMQLQLPVHLSLRLQAEEARLVRAAARDDHGPAGVGLRGASVAACLLVTGSARRLSRRSRRSLHRRATRGASAPEGASAAAAAAGGRRGLFGASASGLLLAGGAVAAGAPGPARAEESQGRLPPGVVRVVNGIRHHRLGGSEIVVSEVGLGTQRWNSGDFNAPNEALCHKFLDRAVLESGVNLVDTAEGYPIPSAPGRDEGNTEEVVGRWLAKDRSRREKLVIATKITGGLNVNPANIRTDLEGSLKRLQTDYVDVYLTHWSFRLSQPQQNWGQSLEYRMESEPFYRNLEQSNFEDVCRSMDKLVREGKIKGWGCCNESPYGATRLVATAKLLGLTPPCVFQNDYSMLNRRNEENGLFEMMSPFNEGVGFMAYNVLAGGMLTGKYLDEPAAPDNRDFAASAKRTLSPRGRMDDYSWGRTLYRYRSEAAVDATRRYAKLAKDAGMPLTQLALRWTRQRIGVSTALVGQSSMAQLEEDLAAFREEKPLPEELMWEIDRVHMRNRLPIFSSEHVARDWSGGGEIGEPIP